MSSSSSLLQDVLRPHALGVEKLNSKLAVASLRSSPPARQATLEDSDDEIIGVTSIPGTPARSSPPSRQPSRPSSPTRSGASKRRAPGPLHLPKRMSTDPLRVFPTDVSQRIFGSLDIADLARCASVCKKWEKSQTLNYVWFQQHRKDNFHDETLPAGKWTRRESKQNWRLTFMQNVAQRDRDLAGTVYVPPSKVSRPNSPFNNSFNLSNGFNGSSSPLSGSGYVTPREVREEAWRLEAEEKARPGKNEMREMYKELGGRKTKGKFKFGNSGVRDKGGWGDSQDDGY